MGRHQGCDDVLVALQDGRFAVVHLVWNGTVDQYPDTYPCTVLYEDFAALQKRMEQEFADWE